MKLPDGSYFCICSFSAFKTNFSIFSFTVLIIFDAKIAIVDFLCKCCCSLKSGVFVHRELV